MIDTNSATWAAVEDACKAEIDACLTRLTRTGLPLPETEFERGNLSALRRILALAERRETYAYEPPRYL